MKPLYHLFDCGFIIWFRCYLLLYVRLLTLVLSGSNGETDEDGVSGDGLYDRPLVVEGKRVRHQVGLLIFSHRSFHVSG